MKTRLALLLSALAVSGCAKNNASVYLAAVCAAPSDATSCTFEATCAAQYIGDVGMDVAVTNRLWLAVEVHNQLLNNSNVDISRTNTNDAFVQEYEVEYVGGLPNASGPIPGSGRVPAGGTSVISLFPVNETIGNQLATLLGAGSVIDVIAKIRLKGVYGDTTEFKTGFFEVPVRICNGCFAPKVCATGSAVYCPAAGQAPASAACP